MEQPLIEIWQYPTDEQQIVAPMGRCAPGLLAEARERFLSPRRRAEWLASRALLHRLMGRYIPIAYTPQGKPCLPDAGMSLSISHTLNYVAIAIIKGAAIGIDIQAPRAGLLRLEPHICNPAERPLLSPAPAERTEQLLALWSLKESYYKASSLPFFDVRAITIEQLSLGGGTAILSHPRGPRVEAVVARHPLFVETHLTMSKN